MTATDNIITKYNVVILAAGASTRFGAPKQLLAYNGMNLIRHAIEQAQDCGAANVIVVLGSHANEIKVDTNGVTVVENVLWAEGISSSIRAGLTTALQLSPSMQGLMLMVCDQPYLSSSLLQKIIHTQQKTGKPIVASDYDGAYGTPALFHRTLFPALQALRGDTGAKKIMDSNSDLLELVSFPLGHVDIDVQSDYELLKKYSEK